LAIKDDRLVVIGTRDAPAAFERFGLLDLAVAAHLVTGAAAYR
jgi:hypothetical protein